MRVQTHNPKTKLPFNKFSSHVWCSRHFFSSGADAGFVVVAILYKGGSSQASLCNFARRQLPFGSDRNTYTTGIIGRRRGERLLVTINLRQWRCSVNCSAEARHFTPCPEIVKKCGQGEGTLWLYTLDTYHHSDALLEAVSRSGGPENRDRLEPKELYFAAFRHFGLWCRRLCRDGFRRWKLESPHQAFSLTKAVRVWDRFWVNLCHLCCWFVKV